MTTELVRTLCQMAGLDVRDDDLPALATALEGHMQAVRGLRELPGVAPDRDATGIAAPFDARWS